MKECDLMNTEFAKALIYAGPEIHAVGLVVNIQERSSLQLQLMIGLLHELKIDMKHVVIIFTHGDSLLSKPTPTDLRRRCELRCELLPQHVQGLQCMTKLLKDVENRFIVVENLQVRERNIIMEQLFRHIDSIAVHPMTNNTFHKSLEWWNKLTAKCKKEERELKDAKDRLLTLQTQCTKTDLEELRSTCSRLEEEQSALTSNRGQIDDIENTLAEMRRVKCKISQVTTESAPVVEELRRIEEEEWTLRQQEDMLKELKGKLKRSFEEKVEDFMSACANVISHREEGISTLENAADEIDKLMKAASGAKVAGYSAGIIGAAIFTVGAGLLLGGITAPAAIPILAIGGTIGAAGSVTAIGGTIGQLVKKSKIMKRAKEWLKNNKRMCEALIDTHDRLSEEYDHVVEVFPCSEAEFKLPRGIGRIGEIVSTWKGIMQHGGKEATNLVVTAALSSVGVAQGVLEGFDAGAEVSALAVKIAAKAAGGVAVGLSAVVIVLDLGFLVKSSYELNKIRKGLHTKASQALLDLASAVREENNLLREAHGHCIARSGVSDHEAYTICNPSLGTDDRLQGGLAEDLESDSNCLVEPAMSGDHVSIEEDKRVEHDGDDESMIPLETADDQHPSEIYLEPSTAGISASQLNIQEDRDTESDSDSSADSGSTSIIGLDDVPETNVSATTDGHTCIIS